MFYFKSSIHYHLQCLRGRTFFKITSLWCQNDVNLTTKLRDILHNQCKPNSCEKFLFGVRWEFLSQVKNFGFPLSCMQEKEIILVIFIKSYTVMLKPIWLFFTRRIVHLMLFSWPPSMGSSISVVSPTTMKPRNRKKRRRRLPWRQEYQISWNRWKPVLAYRWWEINENSQKIQTPEKIAVIILSFLP